MRTEETSFFFFFKFPHKVLNTGEMKLPSTLLPLRAKQHAPLRTYITQQIKSELCGWSRPPQQPPPPRRTIQPAPPPQSIHLSSMPGLVIPLLQVPAANSGV